MKGINKARNYILIAVSFFILGASSVYLYFNNKISPYKLGASTVIGNCTKVVSIDEKLIASCTEAHKISKECVIDNTCDSKQYTENLDRINNESKRLTEQRNKLSDEMYQLLK